MFCQKISLHGKENRLFSFLKFSTIKEISPPLTTLRCIVVLSKMLWGRYLRIENILLSKARKTGDKTAQVHQSFPLSVPTLPLPGTEIRMKSETVLSYATCPACPGFHLTSKLSEIKMFVSSSLQLVQVSGVVSVLCLHKTPLPPSRGESHLLVFCSESHKLKHWDFPRISRRLDNLLGSSS